LSKVKVQQTDDAGESIRRRLTAALSVFRVGLLPEQDLPVSTGNGKSFIDRINAPVFEQEVLPSTMKTEVLEKCNVCDGTTLDLVDPDCNIARCGACGYIFDNPRPTLEELIRFYSRPTQYDSWLTELEERDRIWNGRMDKLQSTKKPGSLLDVGTGIGQFLAVARSSYTEVYGTEVSSKAIEIAKRKYGLDLFRGTIDNLPSGKDFDNITLFHVLEHVPDPKVTLEKCHSLLSERGILVIAVPNEVASLRNLVKRTLVRAGIKKPHPLGKFGLPRISLGPDCEEVHLSHFTPRVLGGLLTKVGFSIIRETLDTCYLVKGIPRVKADMYYYSCLAFLRVFKINIYDTMLVIARKAPSQANREVARGH
jgi:SAM-dependent methyltransferase